MRTTQKAARDQKQLAIVGIAVALVVGIATVLATLLAAGGSQDAPAPTKEKAPAALPDQIEALRHNLASAGWQVQESADYALRDDGRKSLLFILHRGSSCLPTRQSDELRIYDIDAGTLHLGLSFQPTARGCNAMSFRVLGVGKYHAQFASATDTVYLLGEFAGGGEGPDFADVPVEVNWDPNRQTYDLRPLLRSGANLLEPRYTTGPLTGMDKWWFSEAVKRFANPIALTSKVSGWGASDVALRTTGTLYAPVIAGLYRLTAGNPNSGGGLPKSTSPVVYEAAIWSIYNNVNGRLFAGNCRLPVKTAAVINSENAPDGIIRTGTEAWMKRILDCDADPSKP